MKMIEYWKWLNREYIYALAHDNGSGILIALLFFIVKIGFHKLVTTSNLKIYISIFIYKLHKAMTLANVSKSVGN